MLTCEASCMWRTGAAGCAAAQLQLAREAMGTVAAPLRRLAATQDSGTVWL